MCQYPLGITEAGDLFLWCLGETFRIILTALPCSGILGVLCSTTTSGDLGSDDLIFSALPISPSP